MEEEMLRELANPGSHGKRPVMNDDGDGEL